MAQSVGLVVLGLVALFFGGDSLVKGAARLASAFGVPALTVGLTVVAFGTSVPELLVSIDAASKGASGVALGNVIGSNIANVALILGVSAIILPLTIEWSLLRREIPYMIGASIVTLLLALDGSLSQTDGAILFAGFIVFTVASLIIANRTRARAEMAREMEQFEEKEGIIPITSIKRRVEAVRLLAGLALLALGAQWTVDGAVGIARGFAVPEFIIGLTIVAIGTSLPELTASIMGSLRKENDIVVGNVIGSNIANLLAILGLTAMLQPIPVPGEIASFDLPIMVGFALAMLPFAFRNVIGRGLGVLFLLAYAIFITVTVL
jgi:cation:H+ antiporter